MENLRAEANEFTPSADPSVEPNVELIPGSDENKHLRYADQCNGQLESINILAGGCLHTFDSGTQLWTKYSRITKDIDFEAEKYSSVVFKGNNTFVVSGGFDGTNALSKVQEISMQLGYENNYEEKVRKLQNLQERRYMHCSLVFQGTIYVMGGQLDKETYLSSCERLTEGGWEVLPGMNKSRSCFSAFATSNFIFVAGGFDGFQSNAQGIEKLNPQTMTWEEVKVDFPMYAGMGVVVRDLQGTEVWLIGGSNGENVFPRILKFNSETGETQENTQTALCIPRARPIILRSRKNFFVFGGGSEVGEFWQGEAGTMLDYGPDLNTYHQVVYPYFNKQ